MRPPLPPLPIWGLLTPACAAGEKEREWCFYSWTEPTEPIMYSRESMETTEAWGQQPRRGLQMVSGWGPQEGWRSKEERDGGVRENPSKSPSSPFSVIHQQFWLFFLLPVASFIHLCPSFLSLTIFPSLFLVFFLISSTLIFILWLFLPHVCSIFIFIPVCLYFCSLHFVTFLSSFFFIPSFWPWIASFPKLFFFFLGSSLDYSTY